ncbi:MAG: urease accessory protein UreD [Hyphomicrobiaceae bacterium]|nr:urease accessory protein UreD [Hyphomicrobiaceae bacterium]
MRFPKPADGSSLEAVLLNTAGGLTGGDRIDIDVRLGAGAEAMLTTAAAEKIYRAREDKTAIAIKLRLGVGASLIWLPQATILFDGAHLDRRTEVELAGQARFLAVEMLIFGRQAMGEEVRHGFCRDAWRIRRDGALVFADTLRLSGAIAAALARPATLSGAGAAAMIIYVAPDAASRLDLVRSMLAGAESFAGASAWNGLLVVRAIAREGRLLQGDFAPLLSALGGRPLPRVWHC